MDKAFRYIPKDDAERAIWRYEYYYANYIRARTAPIDFEKLDAINLNALLVVGGHTALYKPIAKEMLQEVGYLLDTLMDREIKDGVYNKVNRYTVAILLATWWEEKKYLNYILGAKDPREEQSKEYVNLISNWTDDKNYLERVQKLVYFLDGIKRKLRIAKCYKKLLIIISIFIQSLWQ